MISIYSKFKSFRFKTDCIQSKGFKASIPIRNVFFAGSQRETLDLVRSTPISTRKPFVPGLVKTLTSMGVFVYALTDDSVMKQTVRLESQVMIDRPLQKDASMDDEAEMQSLASFQKLSFGTMTGICTGVFVKKGLKLLAFLLGGGFVFLQYLHSHSLIEIRWKSWSDGYETRFFHSSHSSQMKSILDFLTSDFQYRTTFLVGFMLGLRMG